MSSEIISRIRRLINEGGMSRASLARAAGVRAEMLENVDRPEWAPGTELLRKLEALLVSDNPSRSLVPIEEIIEEARNGRMFILVDDEDRENEGDLIIPAQMATPDAINFMATFGRGLVCLALAKARVDELGLALMSRANGTRHETAFTVSIEAKDGVSTGISAGDRARTVAVAIDANKGRDDLVTPGHVFPLIARDGGVLVRAGHTEAAVDISRLAGLNPSGVICEIMKEDGAMARLDDLMVFARHHRLKIGTIRDLIAYRRRHDHLVECSAESSFESKYGGEWRLLCYTNKVDQSQHLVLQKGKIHRGDATLVRMHSISVFADTLGQPGPRNRVLQRSMEEIGREGAGIIVLLMPATDGGLAAMVATGGRPLEMDQRNYGIGAQILADLGVHDMTLLTNAPRNMVALEGYGLNVIGERTIPDS